jgi:hypothetical protein
VEQELPGGTSVTAAYVGSRGDHLFSQTQSNGAGGVPQSARPDPSYSTQQLIDNLARSRYHALQLTARRRFASGIDFTGAYTFSESKDDSSRESFAFIPTLLNRGASSASGFQGGGSQFVPRPADIDFGRSEFDVTHNLTFSHLIEIPIGRGRRFMPGAGALAEAILGGWSLAGMAVLRSGEPFNMTRGIDYNDDGDVGQDRPQLLSGSLDDVYRRGGDKTQYLITQSEALAMLNTPTDVTDPALQIPRNAFRARSVRFYDLSVIKRWQIRESSGVQFEANVFNVFNRAQLAAPVANLSSALFGRITGTLAGSNPRQIQFGLKLSF